MNIYLDLDETLIFSEVMFNSLGGEPFKFRLSGWDYFTHPRPSAYALLSLVGKFGEVKMLTNSTYPYASRINEHFRFGFTSENLITRHKYCQFVSTEWGNCDIEVPLKSIDDKDAILIDNMKPDDPGARNKMSYLGITAQRFISVPEWQGEEDTLDLDYVKDMIYDIMLA